MKSKKQLKAEYDERVKWFTDRIGKTIWRTAINCPCLTCKRIYGEGLTLINHQHAHYVADCSMEGGIPYFDTEQERDEYEANQEKK